MTQRVLTADTVAKLALAILENDIGVVGKLHRAYEDDFTEKVNGYKKGGTISIRRPADFTVRTGPVMNTQEVIEGKVAMTVDQQIGVDFQFSSTDLTLSMDDLTERVMKPAMSSLISHFSADVMTQMYKGIYNAVGTPGTRVDSFADFGKAPERLDEMAVPTSDRLAALCPADHWALLGSQTALYMSQVAEGAYRDARLGMIGGVDTYMSQVVPSHTNGTADNTTPVVKGSSQEVSYTTAKDSWTQTLLTDGWDASATITEGTVFTIADVYMVNPKTRVNTGILQQFVVMATVTADGTTTNTTSLTISPPIITSGPHQTVTYSGDMNDNTIIVLGAASATQKQNLVFHKNTMALAVVPMEMPEGAVNGSRRTHKGWSCRVIPVYDGVNDVSKWRLDMLYGRKLIAPHLATRLYGT